MSNISPLINVMKTAYNKVNRRIYRDFGEIENLQGLDGKIDRFFNKTYEFIEYNLKDYLTYCRPEWEFLDDKNSTFKKDSYYWLLEPLSGKENFKRSIPIFSSSISVFFNDKVVASSIYDPLRNDFYFTEEGKGAFLNDHRIRVSSRKFLENSLISIQLNNSSFKIDIESCLADKSVEDHILQDRINGVKKYKVKATPTLIINGKKFDNPTDYKKLKKYIEKLI